MVITEEELRQAWQNGRGRIPAFPPGTRFTPAAADFLRAVSPSTASPSGDPAAPQAGAAPAAAQRRVLRAPPGQRLIFTASDLDDLLAGGAGTLVVHPSVTVTHAALERLRKAGVRVIPFVEPAAGAPEATAAAAQDEALLGKVRQAVLARLGGPVDPALLDAVLRRVLAALK